MADKMDTARAAVEALNKAIEILDAKSVTALPLSELNKINQQLPKLKSKRNVLQAAINANNAATLAAPTDAQFNQIKQTVSALEDLTAKNMTVSAIIEAASGAAEVLLT